MEYKIILIVNLGGIGDVLLSFPALQAIKQTYKDSKMLVLSIDRTSDLYKSLNIFEEFHVLKLDKKQVFPNLQTLLKLRSKKIDLAINMRTIVANSSAFKIRMVLALIGAKVNSGRNTDGRGAFFDIKIPETLIGQKSEMEYDLDLARVLGAQQLDRSVNYPILEIHTNKVEALLRNCGFKPEDRIIGIHPGGTPSHRWPLDKFIGIIKKYEDKYRIVITGSKDEKRLGAAIAQKTKAVNFAGMLDIFELGALIKKCSLFISNDTGPMHIAAALKIPQIGIFGPGDIIRFDPRNINPEAVVFYKKADCAPCIKEYCESQKCLTEIKVDEVFEAAVRLLKE